MTPLGCKKSQTANLKLYILGLKLGILRLKLGISETQTRYFWDSNHCGHRNLDKILKPVKSMDLIHVLS